MMNQNKRWVILDKAFSRTVLTVALIEFSEVGSGLIDGIITSRFLGAEAMAAVGICHPVFSIAGVVSGVLALGMQSVCSKEIGKGNFKSFSDTATMSALVGFVLSLLLTVLTAVLLTPFIKLLGAKDTASAMFLCSRDYLHGFYFGIPGLIVGPLLAPAINLDNGGSLVRKAAISGAAADVALDLAAVKLNMGVFGMGLATALSSYVNVGILLLHYLKKDRMLHFSFRASSLKALWDVLPNGTVVAVRRLANVIRPLLVNNYIIMLGGSAAMSALSIKNNAGQFAEIFGAGVAGAVPMIMGVAVGEKSIEDIEHIAGKVHRYVFRGDGIIAVTVLLLAKPLAAIYVDPGTEVYTLAVFAVRALAAELILQTLLSSRISYLNLISKRGDSQLLQFSMRLLAVVPSVLIMGRLFGVYGVLSGFLVGYAILTVAVYAVNAFRKKSARVTAKDYLRLDSSYDIGPGDMIELEIKNMDDASLVSEQLQMFCRGHKLDQKKSYYAALALEESVRLIYESNHFSPDTAIDLRAVVQDGDIILRIRDNGNSAYPFGGTSAEGNSDDPFANVGVKMLRKAAKDIKYVHSLKINYTIITI